MLEKKINILTLALSIAFLPPIWAVLAPCVGVSTGSVALICAAVYATNGNKIEDAFKICAGFVLGDVWSVISVWVMETLSINPNIELYMTLFVLGGFAVLIGDILKKHVFTPAWLCGWAIGLTIIAPLPMNELGTLPIEIAVAMIVGVLYAGVGADMFQKILLKNLKK